ncbi:MAG: UvrD-helicase domain-containing protein [Oscillospiraceae bacterium]|nr:UvrD-helicase domain-containing protein [Oscillospiraceae bacterium]
MNVDFTTARKKALAEYFSRMNDMQREAVFAVKGPVLILAGAGSGKTTVLINRIANMIAFGDGYSDENTPPSVTADDIKFLNEYDGSRDEETVSRLRDLCAVNPVRPYNILAITFTNKAAGELRERLAAMLGEDISSKITAATFHSACVRILRREIDKLGYSRSFTIYDADDSQRMIKACLETLDISDKSFPPKAVMNMISSAKDKLIDPDKFEEQAAGDYRKLTIAKVYREYRSRMRAANAVDFDDIICLTVELFEQEPDVLDHYQNLYRYIMVDEYQDTNTAQFRLVSLLASKYRNICVVGDDDQSIYRFRGATIENILSFEDDFENSTVIRLEQNYRSTQNILSAANCVVQNNTARKDKKLWTDKGDGGKITVYKSGDENAEAKFIADKIEEGHADGKNYSDYAILYRMNAQSNSIERTFTMRGIPYKVVGGMRFFDRKEIKDIIAYLSVINNPSDVLRFKRIVNEPKRGIGDSTVSMIEQIASDLGTSPVSVMRDSENYAPLSKKSAALTKLAGIFDLLTEAAENGPLDSLIDLLLDKTGYGTMLKNLGDEGSARLENINELKSSVAEYVKSMEEAGEIPELSGFLEEIALYTDIDRMDTDADAVCMMTVHSAKGLEFPVVFIAGMEEGIFPGIRSLDTPDELEEERRLAYVAITRAKEQLFITHAQTRMLFGQTNRNLQSRFIKEIDKDYIERIDSTVKNKTKPANEGIQASKNYSLQSQLTAMKLESAKKHSNVEYSAGERVKHSVFGEGTILSAKKMGNDSLLEVAFDEKGTKKIMANFAKIVKL